MKSWCRWTFSPVSLVLFCCCLAGTALVRIFPNVSTTEHNKAQEELRSDLYKSASDFSCIWEPNNDEPCLRQVSRQIQSSLMGTGADIPLQQHRWLFLGDSTMLRLFSGSGLSRHLIQAAPVQKVCPGYQCRSLRTERCNTNQVFRLNPRSQWRSPNFTMGEGPSKYGLQNPFCQDCAGCNSVLLWCSSVSKDENKTLCSYDNNKSSSNNQGMYGGYISVEFARDVEVQTELYTTTQENIALYLEREWNSPAHVSDFGYPICIVSTGHHDASIPNITKTAYLSNVEWYLKHLSTQCDHIIWLANNVPKTNDYSQKKSRTQQWNLGVRDILFCHFWKKSSFIDIFDASANHLHEDNIHMDGTWYKLLGAMFLKLIQHKQGVTVNETGASLSMRLLDCQ